MTLKSNKQQPRRGGGRGGDKVINLYCNQCGNKDVFRKEITTSTTVGKNRKGFSGSQGKKYKVKPATREIRYFCLCGTLLDYVSEVRVGQRWIPNGEMRR